MNALNHQLEVQNFLNTKTSFGLTKLQALHTLTEELGISVKLYLDKEDRMALLDYSQIKSPKSHPVVIECRSLIICVDTFKIISRKFDRFFNFGECPDYYKDFNFNGSVIMEKADGSLIGIYNRNGMWQISTRGMAKAEGEHASASDTNVSFREKVLEAFGFKSEKDFQQFFNKNCITMDTYVFEYVSPENQIVTKYETPEMVLLGINGDGREKDIQTVTDFATFFKLHGLNVRPTKMFKATALEELQTIADNLQNLEEGFVVWDFNSGKRVKIKSSTYVIAHRLGGSKEPTRKDLLTIVLEGESAEFITYFPNLTDKILELQNEVQLFETNLVNCWQEVADIENQKQFALAVVKNEGAGFLFEARKQNKLPLDVFRNSDIEKQLRAFGCK